MRKLFYITHGTKICGGAVWIILFFHKTNMIRSKCLKSSLYSQYIFYSCNAGYTQSQKMWDKALSFFCFNRKFSFRNHLKFLSAAFNAFIKSAQFSTYERLKKPILLHFWVRCVSLALIIAGRYALIVPRLGISVLVRSSWNVSSFNKIDRTVERRRIVIPETGHWIFEDSQQTTLHESGGRRHILWPRG